MQDKLSSDKEKLLKNLENEELKNKLNYERMKEEKISLEKYKMQREVSLAKISTFKDELLRLDEEKLQAETALHKSEDFVKKIYSAQGFEKVPKELMQSIVERINVKSKDDMEIILKLSAEEIKGVF